MHRQAPVRVVIVDDSPTLRGWLRYVLNSDPRLQVVGQAGNADEARDVIKRLDPDVITLDIEMPQMSGLEFLEKLMRLRPMPVIMLSALTSKGSEAALQAMSLGALDCIWKPRDPREMSTRSICDRVVEAAQANIQTYRSAVAGIDEPRPAAAPGRVVLIGASTGGVTALETILHGLPSDVPPIVIAQHMPDHFLRSFAVRLDGMFAASVAMAQDDEPLEPGMIRLAPAGDFQTAVTYRMGVWTCRNSVPEGYEEYRPSVDHLFKSALPWADRVTAVILTGLGRDGAWAMKQLRDAGARTLGQDEASSAVYGMPKAAAEADALTEQIDIRKMADRIIAHSHEHV